MGKKHVFKKIIVGVEKQLSVACEERHGDVTKIPALFVFLYSFLEDSKFWRKATFDICMLYLCIYKLLVLCASCSWSCFLFVGSDFP